MNYQYAETEIEYLAKLHSTYRKGYDFAPPMDITHTLQGSHMGHLMHEDREGMLYQFGNRVLILVRSMALTPLAKGRLVQWETFGRRICKPSRRSIHAGTIMQDVDPFDLVWLALAQQRSAANTSSG